MEAIAIREELKMFHGTTQYHKHLFPGKSPIVLTDGCKYVMDECKAYWLFDAILQKPEDLTMFSQSDCNLHI
jgi:hypothetical protein